jgi:glycosyltransferase involved in cell wall biosynthesis
MILKNEVAIILLKNKKESGLFEYAEIYNKFSPKSELFLLNNIFNKNQWIILILFFRYKNKCSNFINEIVSNFNLIHICDNPIFSYKILKILKNKDVKVLYTLHDPNMHEEKEIINKIKNYVRKFCIARTYKIIKESNNITLHIHKEYKIPKPINYVVKEHPLYEGAPEKSKNQTSNFKIGFYGRLEYYKGIDLFLKIIIELDKRIKKNDNIEIVIAGQGIVKAPILNNIKIRVFNEFLNTHEFNRLVKSTDLILMPYRQVSQSGILMKSKTYCVPVITSELKNLTDNFTDQVTGYSISIYDIELWVKRILNLYKYKDDLLEVQNKIRVESENYRPALIVPDLYAKIIDA